MSTAFQSIDHYISTFPESTQEILNSVRQTIREEAPGATEKISYQIPTFYQNENLIHFAAFAHHIGLYPGAKAMEVFAPQLSQYKTAKGSIQFPIDQPMPLDLIRQIVRYRVEASAQKKASKSKKGSGRTQES